MMIEITTEKKSEMMDHAHKAYEHIGKMIECLDNIDDESAMGHRQDDEWYIRRYNGDGSFGMRRYGMRDDDMRNYGERSGNKYSRPPRMGYRDPYFD